MNGTTLAGAPDPPLTVNASEFGALWVFLRWIPGFNGNSPIEEFVISASPDIRIRLEVSTAEQNNNRLVQTSREHLVSCILVSSLCADSV